MPKSAVLGGDLWGTVGKLGLLVVRVANLCQTSLSTSSLTGAPSLLGLISILL